jgi:HlyD family secretion protein
MNTVEMIYRSRLEIFQVSAEENYYAARTKYDENFENYKKVTRSSDNNTIESLLAETLETTKVIGEAVKSLTNYLDAWTDYRSQKNLDSFSTIEGYQTDLSSYTSKTNSHVSSLLAAQSALKDGRESITGAERDLTALDKNNPLDLVAAEATVKDKEAALAELLAEPEALDLRTQELTVNQKQNDLLDEKKQLAYYTIKSSIDGVVSEIDLKKGDSISSGSTVATIISKQQIAELSLNEVDAAKVKIGQKATMTFDAIGDLTITGEVSEVDTLGTVSSGVVTYGVTIILDTQDDQVKPGMSVSASIITEARQDVLLVPNSAVKASGDENYVEIIKDDSVSSEQTTTTGAVSKIMPKRQIVVVGLSNDTMTEIISGIKEGDQIVTQTSTSTTSSSQKTTSTSNNSLFNMTSGGPPGR